MIVWELNKECGRGARGEGPELPAPAPLGGLAGLCDVASLRSLWTVNDFELDLLAFFERPEAGTLNRREVHEHVVPALAFNESVTLRVVEPLHLAGNTHTTCLPCEKSSDRCTTPVEDSADLTRYKNKDRYMRPYRERRPAQRQPATVVGSHWEVNCTICAKELREPYARAAERF